MVGDMERVALDESELATVRNGGRLPAERYEGAGPWALLEPDGELRAVHEIVDGRTKAGVVIPV